MKFLHRFLYLLKEIPTMLRRLFTGSAIAGILLLAFATSVAAHDATSDCESITLINAAQWTADIKRTDVEPDVLIWDDQPGNGTYAVRAGTYRISWSDGFVYGELVVGACEQPSPTPTPTPDPSPSPTPFVWIPPTAPPDPTPTPQASPTPSPTPSATPTPEPTPTEPPSLTPPPTDMTADADILEPAPVGLAAALVLVLMAAGSVWLAMRRAR